MASAGLDGRGLSRIPKHPIERSSGSGIANLCESGNDPLHRLDRHCAYLDFLRRAELE